MLLLFLNSNTAMQKGKAVAILDNYKSLQV